MKKQIVITLTETDGKWTGKIYGQVDKKRTETEKTTALPTPKNVVNWMMDFYLNKIEEWMEQIQ